MGNSISPLFLAARFSATVKGGSDPTKLLGGFTAKKWGPPTRFSLFFPVTFPFVMLLILSFSDSYLLHGVKKLEKRKVQ
jgi:hypothetical protein